MIKTNNPGYGYHGEIATSAWIRRQIDEAYSNTVAILVRKGIATSEEEAVEFLDSRMGRHLGDEVYGCETINEIHEVIRAKAPGHMKHFREATGNSRAKSK